MICSRRAALAPALGMLLLLAGCGSNSKPFNDTPSIIGLFPSTAAAGGQPFTMNIAGTGFIATSVAYWNNSPRTTTFNPNSTQLSVSITAQDIAAAGTAQVTVVNPAPGGGASTAVAFTITPPANPVPAISSLSPSSTAVGVQPPGGILTVNGSNFIASSSVAFNGAARSATFVSSSRLTVQTTPSDVAANATIQITVSNPAPGGSVSNSVPFTVGTGSAIHRKASLAGALQSPLVISVSAAGGPANGQSGAPALSADGRFIAFYSTATNLVARGTSGNVFVRDTCIGAASCTPRTIAADLAPDGSAPNGIAAPHVALSADGRFVAFASEATNLAGSSDTAAPSGQNIYLRDLCVGGDVPAGCSPRTELVSLGTNSEPANNSSTLPSLSADGRFVAFASPATNLGGAANGKVQVYVRDTCAGANASPACVPSTTAASVDGKGQPFTQGAGRPAISADGRYVAFVLGLGASDANGTATGSRVLLRDTCLGEDAPATCIPATVAVSLAADDAVLGGISGSPSLSTDGRFVAFESQVPGRAPRIFLRDTCLGSTSGAGCVPSTTLLSANATAPFISSSGRYISFASGSSASAGAPSAGFLYVYDTCFGAPGACTAQAFAISAFAAGSQGEPLAVDAATPAPLLPNGGFVAFFTSALLPNLPLSGHGDVLLANIPF